MTIAAVAPVDSRADGVTILAEIGGLVRRLRDAEVAYCHWKSNEHLAASLAGLTDLDVLVARGAIPRLAAALADTSFRRTESLGARRYPGIESYLGLDAATGTVLHLHLHYQLTVGERYLKGYRLPWEEHLLATRRAGEGGVLVPEPSLELLLLLVRSALKLRTRDRILADGGRPWPSGGAARELAWLRERADQVRLEALASSLLGTPAAHVVREMLAAPAPTVRHFGALARAARPALEACRTFGPAEARLRRWIREGQRLAGDASWWPGSGARPSRRALPQGGLVIAFVGPDGAGKSTLVHAVHGWLATHLDARMVYFGSGQGPVSPWRRALQGVAAVVRHARGGHPVATEGHVLRRGRSRSRLRSLGDALWVMALARERRRCAAFARRARNLGCIVLCDRFPQSEVPGNEGPTVAHWQEHPSWWRRAAARSERAAILAAEQLRPDLVVKLRVDYGVARHRKPDTPEDQLALKLDILSRLEFASALRVVEVDANRALPEVLRDVQRLVWERI